MEYSCAFCGEENDVVVDESGARRQTFTEDCTVCCRPIQYTVTPGTEGVEVVSSRSE